jgi:hypothetical protein
MGKDCLTEWYANPTPTVYIFVRTVLLWLFGRDALLLFDVIPKSSYNHLAADLHLKIPLVFQL